MSYQPAGILKRIIAFILDGIIVDILAIPIAFIFLGPTIMAIITNPMIILTDPTVFDPLFGLTGILVEIVILVWIFFYMAIIPGILDGQSIGKKIMGLQVRKLMPDGSTESTKGRYGTHTVRFIAWIIDVFLLCGGCAIAVTERKQRTGDMIAGTIVAIKK
ncbi:MAG: RDD family protein [Candidatus Hermodarchaeota archaeon]